MGSITAHGAHSRITKPHGRLLKYDPMTKKTTVLLEGLNFANEVALSADEDFVLVAESYHYQF
ncbi:Strictosidine synthase [compost metagenome]